MKNEVEQAKKRYVSPAIIHELELETRAGSPVSIFPEGVDDGNPLAP